MKKVKFLFTAILLGISMISCSDDDGDSNSSVAVQTSVEDIVGSWNLVGYEINDGKSNVEVQGITVSQNFKTRGSNFDYVVNITSDEMTASGTYDVTVETTVGFQGQNQTTSETVSIDTADIPEELLTTSWNLQGGDTIVGDNNGTESEAKITSISDSRMVWEMDLSMATFLGIDSNVMSTGNGDFQIDGLSVDVSGTIVLTLEK